MHNSDDSLSPFGIIGAVFAGFLVVALLIGALVGAAVGIGSISRNYSRNQRLADERNQVQINDIQIAQTQQLVKVEQQKAQIRVVQAQGIADAQKIINSSLTDAYLQYEAIQAQMAMANSPNHTEIYIPVGNDGIPLVRTVNPSPTADSGK